MNCSCIQYFDMHDFNDVHVNVDFIVTLVKVSM